MAGPLSVHSRRVKLPFVRICYFIFLIRADRMPVLQLIYLFNLQEVTILRGLNYRLRRKKKKKAKRKATYMLALLQMKLKNRTVCGHPCHMMPPVLHNLVDDFVFADYTGIDIYSSRPFFLTPKIHTYWIFQTFSRNRQLSHQSNVYEQWIFCTK